MFKALGWNMKSHYEVVREFSQKDKSTDGGTKKVDYAFKINGKLKFFIEAKEASIHLDTDKDAIYQAKRYAYSSNGKAPIVILTDFEEFRVFNVIKAPLMDNTDRELLKTHTMRYTDYLKKWDLLWNTFSRVAVENGSLDKLRGKIDKNTKTMDVDFLEQITSWRELLAKNVAIRNENLNVDEINEAVQRILDRLVFIRNLEDREIEPENTLLYKTKKSQNIYKSLIPIFNSLNTTYNGLLFKKHFSEEINVDDKTIHDIIRQMNYPVSPFQFDVIEPEILGRIYEKFLGSKIRLTDSHRAKIEEKIEVRKAGGVYYTPEYIVEYIVQNTVGKKIEGLTPEEIKNIKILDPACGSGSFLIGAYSYLLDYHQKWYSSNKTDKNYKADWYKSKDGEIKVRLDKRSDILRNNIFGVDIDKEATEVSIMSLYLKMLDDGFDKGERDLFFVKGSVLPDMVDNIKCGNSLIGTDYFDGRLDYEIGDLKKIRPFDWSSEYTDIMNSGGFDCVIGNPPYIRSGMLDAEVKKYYSDKFISAIKQYDIYVLFIQKGIQLLKQCGLKGYIISNKFLVADYGLELRKFILNNTCFNIAIDVSNDNVFSQASVYPYIVIFQKENDETIRNKCQINYACNFSSTPSFVTKNQMEFFSDSCIFDFDSIGNEWVYKIEKFTPLSEFVNITRGFRPPPDKLKTNNTNEKYLIGKDISEAYYYNWSGNTVNYIPDKIPESKPIEVFKHEKILFRDISLKFNGVFDETGILCLKTIYFMFLKENITGISLKYILGILNSELLYKYYKIKYSIMHISGGYLRFRKQFVDLLPIPNFDFTIEENMLIHNEIVNSVDEISKTKNNKFNSISESDKSLYNKKIDQLDKRLNELVYTLYGLTDDEIKSVKSL